MAIALCSALPLAPGGVPMWVHLLPAGPVRTIDGRGPYRVQDCPALMRASLPPGGKLPLDENHSIDLAAPKGEPAPARGWIVELQQRADGIWGRVDWTGSGRRIMTDREYSGVSPVIRHTSDGTVSAILRASLTNTPNIAGLRTLHAQKLGADAVASGDHPREIMRKARELVAEFERAGLPIDLGSAVASIMDETAAALPEAGVVPASSARRELDPGDHDVIKRIGVDPKAYAETKFGKPTDPRLTAADHDMIARLGVDPDAYAANLGSS